MKAMVLRGKPTKISLLPLQVPLASHKAEERVLAEIVMAIQVLVPTSQVPEAQPR